MLPTEQDLTTMGAFNQQPVNAGVLIDAAGLQPTSKGARVSFPNGKPTVTDGPFAETKEQLAGFYLIDARDLNDAIQVAAKIPPAREGSIEVRALNVCVEASVPAEQ